MARSTPSSEADSTEPASTNAAGYQAMSWMTKKPDRSRVPEDIAHRLEQLSVKEMCCLYWVYEGKTSDETSLALGRASSTINFHLQTACRKLDVNSRHAAVRYLVRAGMLPA